MVPPFRILNPVLTWRSFVTRRENKRKQGLPVTEPITVTAEQVLKAALAAPPEKRRRFQ